jgi:hypothetical protein
MSTLANLCPIFLLIFGTPMRWEFIGILLVPQHNYFWEADLVHSGISDQGNYAADGWNSTYLRDIQPTDKDGVVFFDTIFPGHYSGRATHTHLLIRSNATLLPNGTLLVNSGSITHNGQLFFHEELRSAVEATYPYKTDTIAVTSNADDQWAKRSMTPSRSMRTSATILPMACLFGNISESNPLRIIPITPTKLLLPISRLMVALRSLALISSQGAMISARLLSIPRTTGEH